MTDGRHTGTGGGNHFVMGGATPADSPFLRRPDLLASLLLYWHNHPSLSYLFSGLFIGPTSQAPRVDEARNDQLYELEIALREIARNRAAARRGHAAVAGGPHAAQHPDRRHRQHPPQRVLHRQAVLARHPTGRLGLLELRAFEMPPHARMSVVQQLLIRALVARFWREPYRAPVTRWGTELHDRWLLPTFIWMDLQDVLAEMKQAGFAFDPRGSRRTSSSASRWPATCRPWAWSSTLRIALEPWHVMGEEARPAARCATSTRRWSASRSRSTGSTRAATCSPATAAPCRCSPPARVGEFVGGRALPRLAAALGAASHDRRARAADLRHRRHLDEAARWPAASTTSRIRAGATT